MEGALGDSTRLSGFRRGWTRLAGNRRGAPMHVRPLWRSFGVGSTLVAATTLAAAFGIPAAHAVATPATAPVPGLASLRVAGSLDAGPVMGPVSVTLVLPFRNRAGLASMVAAIERGAAAPLTSAQFAASFAPDPSGVVAWATAAGLTVAG